MYTELDLKENKKMSEILKANKLKVRQEIIKRNEIARRKLNAQGIMLLLVFIGTVLLVGFVEKL